MTVSPRVIQGKLWYPSLMQRNGAPPPSGQHMCTPRVPSNVVLVSSTRSPHCPCGLTQPLASLAFVFRAPAHARGLPSAAFSWGVGVKCHYVAAAAGPGGGGGRLHGSQDANYPPPPTGWGGSWRPEPRGRPPPPPGQQAWCARCVHRGCAGTAHTQAFWDTNTALHRPSRDNIVRAQEGDHWAPFWFPAPCAAHARRPRSACFKETHWFEDGPSESSEECDSRHAKVGSFAE